MTISNIDYAGITACQNKIDEQMRGGKKLSDSDKMIFAIRGNTLTAVQQGGFFTRAIRALFHWNTTYRQGKVSDLIKKNLGGIVNTTPPATRSTTGVNNLQDLAVLILRSGIVLEKEGSRALRQQLSVSGLLSEENWQQAVHISHAAEAHIHRATPQRTEEEVRTIKDTLSLYGDLTHIDHDAYSAALHGGLQRALPEAFTFFAKLTPENQRYHLVFFEDNRDSFKNIDAITSGMLDKLSSSKKKEWLPLLQHILPRFEREGKLSWLLSICEKVGISETELRGHPSSTHTAQRPRGKKPQTPSAVQTSGTNVVGGHHLRQRRPRT